MKFKLWEAKRRAKQIHPDQKLLPFGEPEQMSLPLSAPEEDEPIVLPPLRKPVQEKTVKMYTNAPEDYDGFGTKTVGTAGFMKQYGQKFPVRIVETPEKDFKWQQSRYLSGMFMAATEEDFPKYKSMIEPS